MINSNTLNFRFYKILESQDLLEHGKYQTVDAPYDATEFNWGQAFYICFVVLECIYRLSLIIMYE